MEKITSLLPAERPREKLLTIGAQALSDQELLAVLIGSGTQAYPVQRIAESVLAVFDSKNGTIPPESLISLPGMGAAKAALVLAALEFCKRRLCAEHRKIVFPKDILPLVSHYADRKQEHFICVSLTGGHEVIASRVVSVGLVNKALVHPREVFADPISDRAAAVMLAHNHPSGNIAPSCEDRTITDKLKKAATTLGSKLLDHVIFGRSEYYSFSEHGLL
ncbi:MAG: DNA repair protein RadC [Spirochaetales bacterium]|nr:DNA repair protein RadC [Spirochaetales bacterium]